MRLKSTVTIISLIAATVVSMVVAICCFAGTIWMDMRENAAHPHGYGGAFLRTHALFNDATGRFELTRDRRQREYDVTHRVTIGWGSGPLFTKYTRRYQHHSIVLEHRPQGLIKVDEIDLLASDPPSELQALLISRYKEDNISPEFAAGVLEWNQTTSVINWNHVYAINLWRGAKAAFVIGCLFAACGCWVGWKQYRRADRRRRGLCGSCAYPVDTATMRRCPECGTEVSCS